MKTSTLLSGVLALVLSMVLLGCASTPGLYLDEELAATLFDPTTLEGTFSGEVDLGSGAVPVALTFSNGLGFLTLEALLLSQEPGDVYQQADGSFVFFHPASGIQIVLTSTTSWSLDGSLNQGALQKPLRLINTDSDPLERLSSGQGLVTVGEDSYSFETLSVEGAPRVGRALVIKPIFGPVMEELMGTGTPSLQWGAEDQASFDAMYAEELDSVSIIAAVAGFEVWIPSEDLGNSQLSLSAYDQLIRDLFAAMEPTPLAVIQIGSSALIEPLGDGETIAGIVLDPWLLPVAQIRQSFLDQTAMELQFSEEDRQMIQSLWQEALAQGGSMDEDVQGTGASIRELFAPVPIVQEEAEPLSEEATEEAIEETQAEELVQEPSNSSDEASTENLSDVPLETDPLDETEPELIPEPEPQFQSFPLGISDTILDWLLSPWYQSTSEHEPQLLWNPQRTAVLHRGSDTSTLASENLQLALDQNFQTFDMQESRFAEDLGQWLAQLSFPSEETSEEAVEEPLQEPTEPERAEVSDDTAESDPAQ